MGYKGYLGSVEFSEEHEIFFDRGLGIRSLISYEGDNVKDINYRYYRSGWFLSCGVPSGEGI